MHSNVIMILDEFQDGNIKELARKIVEELDTDQFEAVSEITAGLQKLQEADKAFAHARTFMPAEEPPPPVVHAEPTVSRRSTEATQAQTQPRNVTSGITTTRKDNEGKE